jgi:lipopolysaccharide export system permease protein
MRLLDRYLFRELLTPLAFCLGGFLIFWLSYDLFSELQDLEERKLHLFDVIEYAVALTPDFLVTILPVALLLALLYTLTHHARHNEITAMRAAGLSLWRLCVPYLMVGLAASLVLFWLNEWCVPRSATWADRILNRYVPKPDRARVQKPLLTFRNDRAHRTWVFSEFHLKTALMLRPQVNWDSPDGERYQLNAASAVRTNGVWTFYNVEEFMPRTNTDFAPRLMTNLLAMPEFDEKPRDIQSEIKINSYQSLRNTRRADIPLRTIWGHLRLHPNLPRAESSWLLTKWHGRLAAPWTCLVVVFIAIPFGAASGRRNLFVGVAGSIFICFAYFIIQQVSLVLGSANQLPPWLAAWLPNIIFGATGLVLTARVR